MIDPNFIQGTEDNAQNLQGNADSTLPGFENPWWDLLELLVLILYIFVAICMLINWIQSIIRFFQGQQKSTPSPKKSLKPGQPGQEPLNNLTPAQERLHNDVKSRLGYATYDDSEIDALIRAGYLDPDAIAAIMRGGSFAIFMDPSVRNIATTLTRDQQKQFVTIVENYRKTHPDLTAHQVYNYLQYTKMKAQLDLLSRSLTGNDPTDPISQSISHQFQTQTQALNAHLDQNAGNSIGTVTDPFMVGDRELSGWYSYITGTWGEWATVKQYYRQGKLVDFSTQIPNGEVDIKIRENDGTGTLVPKWVEVKNVSSLKNAWGTALKQVEKYIIVDHATSVVVQLPQQGTSTNPGPSKQQLQLLQNLEKKYPNVTFEVKMGSPVSGPLVPFDPPSTDWGAYLP